MCFNSGEVMKIKWWEKAWLRAVLFLITIRFNNEASEWWFWERTPLPIGMPTARQYIGAFCWMLGLVNIDNKLNPTVEEQMQKMNQ